MDFYFTYVLKSQKDGKLYVGSTHNLNERLKQHNNGDVQSTKSRRPLDIVYYEACQNKKRAERREKYFKTGFGRNFLKGRI